MRFALRNKDRISKSFGEDFCKKLVAELNVFSKSVKPLQTYKKEGYTNEFIKIKEYEFAIIGKRFDVLTLAYFPNKNK
ncbi:MAG TPA: hypothetical protein DDW85_02280 [Porphyromonadaceae bacterium]|nr:hypothetical protein [Porphyromonadaceae bacterium]